MNYRNDKNKKEIAEKGALLGSVLVNLITTAVDVFTSEPKTEAEKSRAKKIKTIKNASAAATAGTLSFIIYDGMTATK